MPKTISDLNDVIEVLKAKGLVKELTHEEWVAKEAAGDFDEDESPEDLFVTLKATIERNTRREIYHDIAEIRLSATNAEEFAERIIALMECD